MMKNSLMILLAAAALAAGCSQAERKDLAREADQGLHKAGQALDEGVSTTRIKSALLASQKIDASHINVDTEQKTVFLRGSVKSAEQKKLAHELTNTMIEPGQKLVDELKIAANPDENRPQ